MHSLNAYNASSEIVEVVDGEVIVELVSNKGRFRYCALGRLRFCKF